MHEKIKDYYDSGLWDITRVRNVVGKAITEAEYGEITGLEYPEVDSAADAV